MTSGNDAGDLAAEPLGGPHSWVDLFRPYATVVDPVTACRRCGTRQVPDDELGVFLLCPACTGGTLRPQSDR